MAGPPNWPVSGFVTSSVVFRIAHQFANGTLGIAAMNQNDNAQPDSAGSIIRITLIPCLAFAGGRYPVAGPVLWEDFPFFNMLGRERGNLAAVAD